MRGVGPWTKPGTIKSQFSGVSDSPGLSCEALLRPLQASCLEEIAIRRGVRLTLGVSPTRRNTGALSL
eukprot:3344953-Pyramimonas_sp.AAC.1